MKSRARVAVARSRGAEYPEQPPFDPDERFPELEQLPGGPPPLSGKPNAVYTLVRSALACYGLDPDNFGTSRWNPLGKLAPSAGLVVLKPNLVLEGNDGDDATLALTTHGSVVRVLIDYVRLAVGATVEIVIGDVPLQGADFRRIVKQTGLRETVDALRARGYGNLQLLDLRRERAVVDDVGFITRLEQLAGDPRGYVEVDLGKLSRLEELSAKNLERVAVVDYRQTATRSAHEPGRHAYLVPRTILDARLVINIPKLKTHQKAGLTVAIKNLVGVNGDKARIPHFRVGTGRDGGDEYPPDRIWIRRLVSRTQAALQGRSRLVYRFVRAIWRAVRPLILGYGSRQSAPGAATLVSGGAWHGNDTLWRALHDLNHLLLFADGAGALQDKRQRLYFCVVDGIIAGEGDGPLRPVPRREGVVFVGDDALGVDLVSARYMGLDWRRIPQLARALTDRPAWTRVRRPIEDGGVEILTAADTADLAERKFLPPPGWKGHLETPDSEEPASRSKSSHADAARGSQSRFS